MATIKSYTDIEQSEVLAEILSLESADMCYEYIGKLNGRYKGTPINAPVLDDDLPCWSLAALLSILPNYQLQTQDDGIGILCSYNGKLNIVTADNPIDACYEIILKLHELNLL